MDESRKGKVNYQQELGLALKTREVFLEEHPELKSFQDDIDRILDRAVGPENRLKILAFLLEIKLSELNASIATLQSIITMLNNKATMTDSDAITDDSKRSTRYLN